MERNKTMIEEENDYVIDFENYNIPLTPDGTTKVNVSSGSLPEPEWEDDDPDDHWVDPLPNFSWSLPIGKYHSSGFGSRKSNGKFHTGVDIQCEPEQQVVSMEYGVVVDIQPFIKAKESNNVRKTKTIFVEGATGVIVYGNVIYDSNLEIDQEVEAGQPIGKTVNIYRNKSNKHNVCYLHIEWYEPGTRKRVNWNPNYPKPEHLWDPSTKLLNIKKENGVLYK